MHLNWLSVDHNSVYRDNLRKKNQKSHPLYLLSRNILRMARPVLSALSRKCFKTGKTRYLCIVTDQSWGKQMRRMPPSGVMQGGNQGTWIRIGLTGPLGASHISTGRTMCMSWSLHNCRNYGACSMSAHGRAYGDLWVHVALVTVACSTSWWLARPFGWFRLSQWVDDNNTSLFASSTLSTGIPDWLFTSCSLKSTERGEKRAVTILIKFHKNHENK